MFRTNIGRVGAALLIPIFLSGCMRSIPGTGLRASLLAPSPPVAGDPLKWDHLQTKKDESLNAKFGETPKGVLISLIVLGVLFVGFTAAEMAGAELIEGIITD